VATSPNIGFTYAEEGVVTSEVAVNEALNIMDMLLQCAVIDRNLATPPGSPADGDVYLVATSGTGAWSGKDGQIAGYYSGWIFYTPSEGFTMRVLDENLWLGWNGSTWNTFTVT